MNTKKVLYKTVKHFFPEFRKWLRNIDDPRNKNSIDYSSVVMLWVGIMLFLLKLTARRQNNYKMNTEQFIKNLSMLTKSGLKSIPHGDTLEYLMEKLSPEELEKTITKMINRLLRMKSLSKFRMGGHYMISV